MRKIGVMIGSDSDLPQCLDGLVFLLDAECQGLCQVAAVITNSIHRHTFQVLGNLSFYTQNEGVDVWIIGAGMANHLTGTCDAFLRNTLGDDKTVVIGVAFEDNNSQENTQAAILSINKVPGTQVVFDGFVGGIGFLSACHLAVESELLPLIQLKTNKPMAIRSVEEAIEKAKTLVQKGG